MASEKTFHMTPDEFRRHGHAVVDWIADYYSRIESFPVLSRAEPGQIRASLPPIRRRKGESFPAILADIERLILPGVTHWQSPNFYAYFPSNASGPGDSRRPAFFRPGRTGNAVGHQSGVHGTGDACAGLAGQHARPAAEISFHQQRWRRNPGHGFERFTVRVAGGAGAGHELSPAIARGCDGKLVAYTSSQAHSSLEKGAQIAGIGKEQPAPDRSGREFRHAPRGAGAADRAGPQRRAGPVFRLRHRGHHVLECDRSGAGNWPHLPREQTVAACGCSHVRHGGALSRISPHSRRPGIRRQLLLQSAQMDVHQFRLRLLLRRRPQGPHSDAERAAGIPAQ